MNRQFVTVGIAAVVVLVIAAVVYSFFRTASVPPETGAPAVSSEDRAEGAREFIADLEKSGQVDYQRAFDRAQEYERNGQLADAQLLYFFAARNGNADAAFQLAQLNDPNYFESESSLMSEPDPFQAFKWYTVARDEGIGEAATRLEQLHRWAEQAAQNGDAEAERLLLQWK
jgi:hypothetical protein